MQKPWKIFLTTVLVWLSYYAAKIGMWTHNLLIENCILTATYIIVYSACVWGIEKRAPKELIIQRAYLYLAAGKLMVVALLVGVYAAAHALGYIKIEHWHKFGTEGVITIYFLSATFQEILYRACVFRFLTSIVGTWIAVVLSSIFFAAMYLQFPFIGLGGVLFALAYVYTNRIWLAVGFHFLWNLATHIKSIGYVQENLIIFQTIFFALVAAVIIHLIWKIKQCKLAIRPIWKSKSD
jgi:membrane protease YdiL (CAAX protease family)